jgi:hypothetical protein
MFTLDIHFLKRYPGVVLKRDNFTLPYHLCRNHIIKTFGELGVKFSTLLTSVTDESERLNPHSGCCSLGEIFPDIQTE